MLTYWRGTSRQGIGTGELVILDQSYRVIRRIRTRQRLPPDLHEFKITPDDKAILISYPIVRQNLRAVKGGQEARPRGRLGDPGGRHRRPGS